MNRIYRGVKYTKNKSTTWDGVEFDSYHCNDKKILDGLDTVSFTKLSEQDMKSEIDQLIDKKEVNILLQNLMHEARRDWYTNTYPGEYTGD
jgi:hypothetical protein